MPVPVVSSPVENRSYSESLLCWAVGWYHMTNTKPFWADGSWPSGLDVSQKWLVSPTSSTWSNSSIIGIYPAVRTETRSHVSFTLKHYIHASARCKQPSGELFLLRIGSLHFCAICLVPIWLRWIGKERVVTMLDPAVGGGVACETLGSVVEAGIQCMKHCAHNWYLPCRQCTETCSRGSSM